MCVCVCVCVRLYLGVGNVVLHVAAMVQCDRIIGVEKAERPAAYARVSTVTVLRMSNLVVTFLFSFIYLYMQWMPALKKRILYCP